MNLMDPAEALDVRYWAAIQAAKSAKIKSGGSITFAGGQKRSVSRYM